MQVGISREKIVSVHSAHYTYINFSIAMALFLYAILRNISISLGVLLLFHCYTRPTKQIDYI